MPDDWTFGYRADIGYTHGYYRDLSPVMLEFALLSKMQSHRVGRPLRYLELGYGQEVSLGGITCTSAKTGMTCKNEGGHGFSVARARQKLF